MPRANADRLSGSVMDQRRADRAKKKRILTLGEHAQERRRGRPPKPEDGTAEEFRAIREANIAKANKPKKVEEYNRNRDERREMLGDAVSGKGAAVALRICPICRVAFNPGTIRTRKCDTCRASEDSRAAVLASGYEPAFRGPLPAPATVETPQRAGHGDTGHYRGGGEGSRGRYTLALEIADSMEGTYALVSAWPTSAPGLQWFDPAAVGENVLIFRDGRRFDVGLTLEDLYRRAYQLGQSIRHDRYRLLVDGPVLTCHCNGITEMQRGAILLRSFGEYWGAMIGADFGVDISGALARVGLKLGHGAHLVEGQS